MKKIRIYFDMDGVLAKFNSAASIEETATPGYFANREKDEKAISLCKELLKAGFDVYILSSVYRDDHSANEKIEWLQKVGLGDVPPIFVPYGEVKRKFISKEKNEVCFLVDDFTKNLKEFEQEQDFVGIKYYNGINGTNGSWDGFSINNRMSVSRMFTLISSLINWFEKEEVA